nr:ribonuclease H-like domain-containing protein [Tanacetum cinerariifolium]
MCIREVGRTQNKRKLYLERYSREMERCAGSTQSFTSEQIQIQILLNLTGDSPVVVGYRVTLQVNVVSLKLIVAHPNGTVASVIVSRDVQFYGTMCIYQTTKPQTPVVNVNSDVTLGGNGDSGLGSNAADKQAGLEGNSLVSWKSKKQYVISRSYAEAEYIALCSAACELMWIKKVPAESSIKVQSPVEINCENISAIQIAIDHVFHEKTKHFEIDLYFLREKVVAEITLKQKQKQTNAIRYNSCLTHFVILVKDAPLQMGILPMSGLGDETTCPEMEQFNELVGMLNNVDLNQAPDAWKCNVDSSNVYYIISMRKIIEEKMLPSLEENINGTSQSPLRLTYIHGGFAKISFQLGAISIIAHKMEEYGTDEVNFNPTQIFSVHNWTLKKNQPEGPPFTDHMLAICNAAEPVEFQTPNTSSYNNKNVPKAKSLELKLDE